MLTDRKTSKPSIQTALLSGYQRLALANPEPVFGILTSPESDRLLVQWTNPAAENFYPWARTVIGRETDALFDAIGLPEAERLSLRAAIERCDPLRLEGSWGGAGSIEVVPSGRPGAACVVVGLHGSGEGEPTPGADRLATDWASALMVRALDALSAEVAVLDDGGRIVAVNRAWREFALQNGFADASAGVGSNYLNICDTTEGAAAAEANAVGSGLRAVLSGLQSASYVEYPCDGPEEDRWYQVRASGFEFMGRRYAVVSHESLTESKRAEQRHREQLDEMAHHWRMSSLGELASGIAHELNQPLGAITNYMNGCLRRLEAGTIDRDQMIRTARECVELAEFAGGIIKRMRGFASRTTCQYCSISLNDAGRKALQFFRASPESAKVRVTAEFAADPASVRADEVQVQQVVLNLLRNAGDSVIASGRRPGQVHLRTYADDQGHACLSVRDNGQGLPEGCEGRLFDPFFSTKSKGMGLGLSISKTIAEVHGGRLSARNIPEGGAVFELMLPAQTRPAVSCPNACSPHTAPHGQPQSQSQGGSP